MKNKNKWVLIGVMALAGSMAPLVKGQDDVQSSTSAQGGEAQAAPVWTNHVSVEGTVQDIDKETREITLKGPAGDTVTFTAGPNVTKLDQINKGDKVQVDYLESVAMALQKPEDGAAPPAASEGVTVVPEGDEPGAVAAQTQQITATVQKVDKDDKSITLKGPKGNTVTLNVGPELSEKLNQVNPGDKILVQYTQAIAVDVQKV